MPLFERGRLSGRPLGDRNEAATQPSSATLYQTNCARCHGANLQGGNAQSLVDDIWQFGGLNDVVVVPDYATNSWL